RRAGALLHMGSLEGGLGRGGRTFIDWLATAGFSVWQILPLGPTGSDGSPYWVRSDFAGNPAFVDASEWPDLTSGAYPAFLEGAKHWLEDYALFEVLSFVHGGAPWWSWPAELRDRVPDAITGARQQYASELERVKGVQFAFFVQWQKLREHANSRGIRLFGDLPFYVAPDSAETWAHREQFQLDATGRPTAVAGVPPDYFSATGQLWGNPLYDWEVMRRDRFELWRARVAAQMQRVDVLRIDHFRALAAYWAVPASAPDARGGEWRNAPGEELLGLLWDDLGGLPIVAEDLGVITPDVEALRKAFGLPGMRVLQFGFSGEATNPHLPHMHDHDSVVYTGTHDNDTTLGWYATLPEHARQQVDYFLRLTPGSMPDALIRATLGSVGALAVVPMQDLLSLGSEARLNTPGTATGNWSWRLGSGALTPGLAAHFSRLNGIYGRG
ncbi:MAG: 4-alpha-glucanotransferase, partial [Steroidobacteraceae bacterium]